MVKNGRGLLDHRALKSGVSQEWYELSWFIDFFMLIIVCSDAITFGLTGNLICILDF